MERSRRNIEYSFSSNEIVLISKRFGSCCFPRVVILIGIERRESLTPSIFESFDRLIIIIHPGCNDKLIILNGSTVLQNDLIIFRIIFDDGLAFRRNCEFAHIILSISKHIELEKT